MAVAGLGALVLGILSIGRLVSTVTSGSFDCGASLCDPIADTPTLIGGGIVLIVTGVIIASIGSALSRASRQSAMVMKQLLSSSVPGQRDASMVASAFAGDVAPMLHQMLQSLQSSGLLGANVAPVQPLDPVTGQPLTTAGSHDAISEIERDRQLRATGTLASAVVETFRELPMSGPDGQLYELHLDVRPEDRPSYKVRHYALVPTRWAYRVTMGASFPAWVDAADPSRLLIEWERS
jgi:hypothetical protein